MVNKLTSSSKPLGATSVFKRILITGSALVFFLQPGFSKNNEKVKAAIKETLEHYDAKSYTIEEGNQFDDKTYIAFDQVQNAGNPLDFAQNNVDLYYPDMHQHLDSLINHLRDQEQKDTVNFLFQKHIFSNISDPKKQMAAVLYGLENMVFKGIGITKKFSKTYNMMTIFPDKKESAFLLNFNRGYNHWFMGYYKRLDQILADMNKQIDEYKKKTENNRKQIEGIVNTFTVDQVRNNPSIKKLVLETESVYTQHHLEIFPNLAILIAAAKQ